MTFPEGLDMATIDDTPESLPPTPKKRNTRSWKTIAQAALKDADLGTQNTLEALRQRNEARAQCETWQTTNTLNYRLFKAAVGVAVAGWLVVLWLVVR